MDYKAFYDDVVQWISQVNQAAQHYGMESQEFWDWVIESAGAISNKYQNNKLVIMQMIMMVEWLDEVYQSRKVKKA